MSFIHGDGAIHLNNYEAPKKKHKKDVIRLLELLMEKCNEIEAILKELRYFALYLDWGDGKYKHTGFLDEFHYYIGSIGRRFNDRIDTIYHYANNFKKYKFAKLKPDIIQKILDYEEKYHAKFGGDYYIGATKTSWNNYFTLFFYYVLVLRTSWKMYDIYMYDLLIIIMNKKNKVVNEELIEAFQSRAYLFSNCDDLIGYENSLLAKSNYRTQKEIMRIARYHLKRLGGM